MHPLQAPRSLSQCLCLMPFYGSTTGLCTLQEANVPVWFRIFVRLIFRWLVAVWCHLWSARPHGSILAASWLMLALMGSYQSWVCKTHQCVGNGDEHRDTLWLQVKSIACYDFCGSKSHHRVGQNFTSCTQRAPERGPLLELHGFDGQISAPILIQQYFACQQGWSESAISHISQICIISMLMVRWARFPYIGNNPTWYNQVMAVKQSDI
jgi:hypothetical protein